MQTINFNSKISPEFISGEEIYLQTGPHSKSSIENTAIALGNEVLERYYSSTFNDDLVEQDALIYANNTLQTILVDNDKSQKNKGRDYDKFKESVLIATKSGDYSFLLKSIREDLEYLDSKSNLAEFNEIAVKILINLAKSIMLKHHYYLSEDGNFYKRH